MINVIVTGANGFIGRQLIKRLIDMNINVVAIDVSFEYAQFPKSKLLTTIENDISDLSVLLKHIPNLDYTLMYHLAWEGVNGVSKADPNIQAKNIEMTLNCAKLSKQLGVKKLLCAGTITERSEESIDTIKTTTSNVIYGIAKHCAHLMLETYCKSINQNFVWMQFSNIYGPTNTTGNLISYTIEKLKNGKEALFGPALQPYDFIYIDDLIEAIIRLGLNITNYDFYFIGSGSPRQLKDYLLEIGEVCEKVNLVRIAAKPDDGIKYKYEMFDTKRLTYDIGDFVITDFKEGIIRTLEKY